MTFFDNTPFFIVLLAAYGLGTILGRLGYSVFNAYKRRCLRSAPTTPRAVSEESPTSSVSAAASLVPSALSAVESYRKFSAPATAGSADLPKEGDVFELRSKGTILRAYVYDTLQRRGYTYVRYYIQNLDHPPIPSSLQTHWELDLETFASVYRNKVTLS